jgi:hypothetical protein
MVFEPFRDKRQGKSEKKYAELPEMVYRGRVEKEDWREGRTQLGTQAWERQQVKARDIGGMVGWEE